MNYLELIKKECFEESPYFKDEIDFLKSLFIERNYFDIIIIAPQLMEKIAYEIDECYDQYLTRKMGEPSEEEKEVHSLYSRVIKEESTKARVAKILIDLYQNEHFDCSFSRNEFIKYFTKLENIISCRNHLAHDFYKIQISKKRIKQVANEAIELIELLAYYPGLGY
ncbi:hypothetical protein [Desulfobacula sp.]|uniref:hypothetical protein n=1 Tax=Desulfobacula sp. TaxID=2593537 RepID=UPI002620D204|nr:hypothetical protein [Desulfobacula sp.]